MQPKVELVQIRKLGEIVDDSINFLKQNWKPLLRSYFAICGFFWVAGLVIAGFNQSHTFRLQEEGESIYSITYFLTLLITFINSVFVTLTTLCFIVLYREKGNVAPSVEEVWSYVKYYLFRVTTGAFLLTLLCVGGTVCCVIPGIWLTPICFLIITIMVLENATIGYAFNHGFRLIKNNWWETVGALMVMSIIIFAAVILFMVPIMVIVGGIVSLTSANPTHAVTIAIALSSHALQFLYILPAIAMALIYYHLNEIKDDNSLMHRIQMIGKHDPSTDQLPSEEY